LYLARPDREGVPAVKAKHGSGRLPPPAVKGKCLKWPPSTKIISAFGTSTDKKSKHSLSTSSARASRKLAIAASAAYGSCRPKRYAPPASLRLNAARQPQLASTGLRTLIKEATSRGRANAHFATLALRALCDVRCAPADRPSPSLGRQSGPGAAGREGARGLARTRVNAARHNYFKPNSEKAYSPAPSPSVRRAR